jgi:hypothetical protein
MPMDTITFEELAQWADPDEVAALLGKRSTDPQRGILSPDWIIRLQVLLEARGFRVDGRGAPIHFWRNQEQAGFVFAQ